MKTDLKPHMIYFVAGLMSGLFLISQFSFKQNNNNEIKIGKEDNAPLLYKWYPPKLPDQMSFAGEVVPLDRWEVREEMDRQLLYNYYWQSNMLYILKLANRYFPLLEER